MKFNKKSLFRLSVSVMCCLMVLMIPAQAQAFLGWKIKLMRNIRDNSIPASKKEEMR